MEKQEALMSSKNLQEFYNSFDEVYRMTKEAMVKSEFLFGPPKGSLLEFERTPVAIVFDSDLELTYASWEVTMFHNGDKKTSLKLKDFFNGLNYPDRVIH